MNRHIGILISLMILTACASGNTERNIKLAHTHYLMGDNYYKKRSPELAKVELLKAIELNPDNKDAHALLGAIFFLEGVHAMDFLEREQCLSGVAASEQKQGADEVFRKAETHFLRSVELDRAEKVTDSDGLNNLANIALHFKQWDRVVTLCDEALGNVLYANRHMALNTRGWAHYNKGALNEAARDLRQALFHNPQSCLGRYRLAKIYFDQQQYDNVVEELDKVLAKSECPIQEAYQLYGMALAKQRLVDKAKEQFESCVMKNPKSCVANECKRYLKLMGEP